MRSVKSIPLIITLFLLIAWKQASAPDPIVEKLCGKWNWVVTKGGRSLTYYYPATVKYKERIEFEKSGAFRRYRDEKLIVSSNYILKIDSTISSRPRTYWLKNVGEYSQAVTFRGADTLVLTDQCDYCFISIYVRQK